MYKLFIGSNNQLIHTKPSSESGIIKYAAMNSWYNVDALKIIDSKIVWCHTFHGWIQLDLDDDDNVLYERYRGEENG